MLKRSSIVVKYHVPRTTVLPGLNYEPSRSNLISVSSLSHVSREKFRLGGFHPPHPDDTSVIVAQLY